MKLVLLTLLAQYGAYTAPLGAVKYSEAQDQFTFTSLGAPKTFELFYPELPSLKKTSTAVPVIHLPETDDMKSIEKAVSNSYLNMFPRDLLDSDKIVKQLDVKIIEHDEFIDYEIEFVELSDEYNDKYVIQPEYMKEVTEENHDRNFTETESETLPDLSKVMTGVSLVDLLRNARRKYRERMY